MKLYFFDRTFQIIHFDDLDMLNNSTEIKERINVQMSQNEVFVLQIAMLSETDDIINDISSSGNLKISCINTDMVDKYTHRIKSKSQ